MSLRKMQFPLHRSKIMAWKRVARAEGGREAAPFGSNVLISVPVVRILHPQLNWIGLLMLTIVRFIYFIGKVFFYPTVNIKRICEYVQQEGFKFFNIFNQMLICPCVFLSFRFVQFSFFFCLPLSLSVSLSFLPRPFYSNLSVARTLVVLLTKWR